jgi:predicted  nucleic acid-binding Zn-ribbon protein
VPHTFAICGAVYASLTELDNGACPACHACKFIYEAPRDTISIPAASLFEEDSSEITLKHQDNSQKNTTTEIIEDTKDDATVSVRIQRPGKYEINLRQMVESPDRVIGVEKKGVYHLDLHSMVGKKKNK